MRKAFAFAIIISCQLFSSNARPLPPTAIEEVRVYWHLAGLSEAREDWSGARVHFAKVLENAAFLALPIREWYRGLAWLGISRSSARLQDTMETRRNLALAFSHGFLNAALLQEDSQYCAIAGRRLIDSLGEMWSKVATANREEWLQQEPIVFQPTNPAPHPPLIIALHGGNDCYQNFATYWAGVAELTHAIVVVPPGQIRNSETQNSWEYDVQAVAATLLPRIKEWSAKFDTDPRQTYLAGYSQGAQAAIALTIMHPDLFRGAIAISGFLYAPLTDSQFAVASAQHPRIYALSGEFDTPDFLKRIQGLADRSKSYGIEVRIDIEKEMAHEMPLDFERRFADAWQWMRN